MSRLPRASATASSKDASRGLAAGGGGGGGGAARGGGGGGGRGPGWSGLRHGEPHRRTRTSAGGRERRRMPGTVGRLAPLSKRFFGRRQVGGIGETDQRHLGGGKGARRIPYILHALEQNLPGAREHAERQPVGKFAAALAFYLAHRRIVRRGARDLGPGDEMAELGELDEDVGGVP